MTPKHLPEIWALATGVAIVSIISFYIFNSWTKQETQKFGFLDQPRNYTTFTRFNTYRFTYILCMLVCYLILLAFPDILGIINSEAAQDIAKKMSENSYIWAALIVTSVVPNFPVLQDWESQLREKLHDLAFIPWEAQKTISFLTEDYMAFKPNSKHIDMVLDRIGAERYTPEDFTSNDRTSLRHKWCKLSYLFTMIEKKKAEREFTRFIGCCDQILYDRFKTNYSSLTENIDKRIELVESNLGKEDPDPMFRQILDETHRTLDDSLQNCYRLISCGILATEVLSQNRNLAFQYFGLSPAFSQIKPIDWDNMIKSALVIMSAAFFPTIVYYYQYKGVATSTWPRIYPDSGIDAFVWSLVGLAMFIPGLMGATLVERMFWRQKRHRNGTPHASGQCLMHCFLAFLVGYLIGFAVLVFNSIIRQGPLTDILISSYLFPLLPAVTAGAVIYFIENDNNLYIGWMNRAAIDAVSIGLCNALVAMSILLVMEIQDLPSLLYVTVTAGLIGTGVGYIFPESYRQNMRPETDRRHTVRIRMAEDATLLMDDMDIDCKVTSLSPSFATINIAVPRNKALARLSLQPLGEIPVSIVKRSRKRTLLQFLFDTSSETNLENYLESLNNENAAVATG